MERSALRLNEACEVWQSGRDVGSSPLRAAARILTGVPHYFRAEFIDALDRSVTDDEQALSRARTLLTAVSASPPMTTVGVDLGHAAPLRGCDLPALRLHPLDVPGGDAYRS